MVFCSQKKQITASLATQQTAYDKLKFHFSLTVVAFLHLEPFIKLLYPVLIFFKCVFNFTSELYIYIYIYIYNI